MNRERVRKTFFKLKEAYKEITDSPYDWMNHCDNFDYQLIKLEKEINMLCDNKLLIELAKMDDEEDE